MPVKSFEHCVDRSFVFISPIKETLLYSLSKVSPIATVDSGICGRICEFFTQCRPWSFDFGPSRISAVPKVEYKRKNTIGKLEISLRN